MPLCREVLETQSSCAQADRLVVEKKMSEAVVQQSFIVRWTVPGFFDAKWNMTQNLHRTEALSGMQPAETPAPT